VALDAARREELRRLLDDYVETRSQAAAARLIEGHLPLARHLARRFADRGQPLDDLVQVASIGLLKAVERFDADRGVEFATYAAHTILGELKRHFRDAGWAVRAPRRLQELYLELTRLLDELSQTLGRSPTVAELASAAGVTEEEVLEALEAGQAYRSSSLDAPAPGADGEASVASTLGETDAAMATAEQRAELAGLLDRLAPRERRIVHLRFWEDKTQAEIATELGISQMHVSRLLAKSLAALREASG
jgi:RNA polymerase sigma-B factor